MLAPSAASESGKPSSEARRFLDEKTGPENPRVNRNAVLLLTPSKDGLGLAEARVREYLGWEQTRSDLKPKGKDEEEEQKASVDVARLQILMVNMTKAKGRIPEAIRQAYCIVVTVSDKNDDQAFKISVAEDPHFTTIKNDARSRVQDTAITAEALLPEGPYNLWQGGETSRRVKDLAGAFAERPHLPKMLKAQAIVDTLVSGCEAGTFVLRLPRPDKTFRTWWRSRPDEAALADPAMELVLPEAAELSDISAELLAPKAMPDLWAGDEIMLQAVLDYFGGGKVVQIDKGTHQEPLAIPEASPQTVHRAVEGAVLAGKVWLRAGPASLLYEPVPAGVLTSEAKLKTPPATIQALSLLPANLPGAWQDNAATAASIATALSAVAGDTLPWKTVRDALSDAFNARFVEIAPGSGSWPCELAGASAVKVQVPSKATGGTGGGTGGGGSGGGTAYGYIKTAAKDFEPAQIQDLADLIPKLLSVSAKANVPLRFHVRLEVGDAKTKPTDAAVKDVNTVLKELGDGFEVG